MKNGPRPVKEISAEYQKLWDKVWWNRKMAKPTLPEISREGVREVEERWGKEFLQPGNDVEWGICVGKMEALAWVLGADWDEAGDT